MIIEAKSNWFIEIVPLSFEVYFFISMESRNIPIPCATIIFDSIFFFFHSFDKKKSINWQTQNQLQNNIQRFGTNNFSDLLNFEQTNQTKKKLRERERIKWPFIFSKTWNGMQSSKVEIFKHKKKIKRAGTKIQTIKYTSNFGLAITVYLIQAAHRN